ncbi:MAG: PAS domain-containing sensor histidine kinase [Chryseolinea sp.]
MGKIEGNDALFRELVENAVDVSIVIDKTFRIRYLSSSTTRVFGIEHVSLVGRNLQDFVNKQTLDAWKDSVKATATRVFTDVPFTTQNGKQFYFDIQVSNLLENYSVKGLVLNLHDITAKKEKEQSLLLANQQLDQVIFKTTHDLKAPLQSALGLVSLAERASPDEKDQYIAMIKKSLVKLDSFIDEMTHFFRHDKLALQRQHIDLEQLLTEEIEILQNQFHTHKVATTITLSGQVDFYSDLVRVRTIVTNILSNAMKYCDVRKTSSFVKIYATVTGDFCDICITDNGIGIEPEGKKKIFDLFFRSTNQSQGTGIGLFIVKDTIQRVNGTIEVDSIFGEGTAFRIRIPNQLHQPTEAE